MRYEDASQAGNVQAHDETEQLAGNDFSPATGNLITGDGTISGATGIDPSTGAHITAIAGAAGSDDSFDASGKLEIAGQYGTLTIDAQGNYTYVRNPGTPEGVSDTFTYTLADAAGATDSAKLTIAIGNPPILNAQGGQTTIQTANGVVVLPAGVELSDVHVQGRNLVITLPDGSTMVIPDGAVFVPQLVVDGVEVPASNLAALLIDSEPKPAAGDQGPNQLSSGGNFEVPVQPLDPGVPLGDLIPPTELNYTPPDVKELFPGEFNQDPVIGVSAVSVSDEGVSSVNTPIPDNVGNPDTTNSNIATGILPVSDPDNDPLTVTLTAPTASLTSQGVAITWSVSPDGQTVTGSAGQTVVITVHIDFIDAAGAHYTVHQFRPLDHPVHGQEDAVSFVVGATVSDGTSTVTGGAITVSVEDDSPTITGSLTEPTLTVDETILATNASASFAGAFSANFGADGQAQSGAFAWSLGVGSGATGLFDVATGNQVVLTLESGQVVGRAGAGGAIVFTVSVDGSGVVTLDQQRALTHSPDTGPDQPVSMANDSLITLQLVVTDRDGDPASLSVNIASNLVFKDDAPSASTTSATEPTLTVDETNLAVNDSGSFAGLFSTAFGADGAGNVAYVLNVSSAGVGSGLIDVATGQQIFLFKVSDGLVEGRVGGSGGAVAFSVSVDSSGLVTLDQARAIEHSPDTGPNQPISMTTDSLISLSAVVTDRDGDQASASVNIAANFVFDDDTATASLLTTTEPTLTVDETNLAVNDSAGFAGLFATAYGADGAGTTAYVLNVASSGVGSGLFDVATGQEIFLFKVSGGLVEGRVGGVGGAVAFSVTVDGSGVVTLDQARALTHSPDTGPDQAVSISNDSLISLSVVVTDRDGDVATASVNIASNLVFHDDAPSAAFSGTEPTLTVDETVLTTNDSASFAGLFQTSYGADGAGTTGYALNISGTGVDSGLVDIATGQHIYLYKVSNGLVEGRVGSGGVADPAGTVAFSITLNTSSGLVTLDQVRALQHTPDTGPDQPVSMATDSLVTLSVVVTDKDGDVATASVNIASNFVFEDDAPVAVNDGSRGTVDDSVVNQNIGNVSTILANDNYGADGPAAANAITIGTGSLGGTITIDGSGNMLYTSNHNTVPGNTDVETFTYTITDKDGDQSQATFTVSLTDTGPVIGTTSVNVDEEGLSGGIAGTTYGDGSDLAGTNTTQSGTLTGLDFGANGVGNIVLTAVADTGLRTLNNEVVKTAWNGATHTLTGFVDTNGNGAVDGGETQVFTVQITNVSTGAYTFTLLQPVKHATANTEDNATFSIGVTVTDGDNNSAPGSINVLIDDDSPALGISSGSEPTITVDETNLAVDNTGNFAAFLGGVGAGYGADGAGTTAYTLTVSSAGAPSGLFDVASGNQIYLYQVGNTIVGKVGSGVATPNPAGATSFVVSVDANGVVTLDQQLAIQHSPDTGPDQSISMATDSLINLKLTVTDKDGDAVSSSVNIASNLTFKDDAPHLGASSGTEPTITVDETDLTTNASASFAGFLGAVGAGYGADGAGTTVYALSISGTGVDSGLIDVATGQHIYLYTSGSTVVGRVGSGGVADPAGAIAFNVSVDSAGVVTLDQVRAIQHSPDTGPDQPISMATDSLISLKLTVTDKDGDAVSSSVNIASNLTFKDDAPHLGASSGTEPTITVDETDLSTNASASFAGFLGAIGSGYGADGAGTTVYALSISGTGVDSGLIDVATGQHIFLYTSGATVVGRVGSGGVADPAGAIAFNVSVDSSGVVTLDQVRALQHSPDSGPDQPVSMTTDSLISLKLTVTDKDGDAVSSSVNIASNLIFKDDAPTIVVTTITEPTLTVDDTTLNVNASASFAGLFSGDYKADGAGTTTYAINPSSVGVDSGLIDVASGQHIFLYSNGSGGVVGRVGSGGLPNPAGAISFTVTVDGSGLVTLDQQLAIQHSPDTGPDQSISIATDSLIKLTATITDKDGDSATASVDIASNLVFKDDAPTAVHAAAITTGLTNGTGSASANLDGGLGGNSIVSDNFGADGAGKVIFTSATTAALTAQHYKHAGTELSYIISPDGQTLTGFIDTTPNGVVDAGETVFTIQLQTGVGGNEYTITMNQTIDTTQTVNFTDTLFDFIGGNKGWFGIVPNGETPGGSPGPIDNDSHDLLITPTNDTSINTSGILGGVDTGQSVGVGEGFRIDYVVDLTGTPPNNFTNGSASGVILNSGDPVSEANHWYTNGATVTMRQSTGSDVKFTAYNDTDNDQIVGDGTVDTITKIVITFTNSGGTAFTSGDLLKVDTALHSVTLNGVQFDYQFNADGTVDVHNVQGATGANDNPATTVAVYTDTNAGFVPTLADPLGFDSLVVSNIGGDEFKFSGFGAVTTTSAALDLSVPISIVDKDGDVVSSGNLAIHANAASPPVVLDLNGDGVHFLGKEAGVTFDYGAGLVSTAWVDSHDGILVRDANGDGNVTGTEMVFGGNGQTDMEALHAQYGAQLDASDADFTQFAVWNDANSNGVVDANELHSLAEAGITSINLVSDGISYSAANGDVQVAGTATYTKADGSTGTAADAIFATGDSKSTQEVERVAANSNSVALAAAVAAAGFAAAAPAAAESFGGDQFSAIANAVVAKESFGDLGLHSTYTGSALDFGNAGDGGFHATFQALSGSSHTAIAATQIGELTTSLSLGGGVNSLLDATDFGSAMHINAPMGGMDVGMPSVQALVAAASGVDAQVSGITNLQHGGQVEQILADALHGGGHGAVDINALLNALPGANGAGGDINPLQGLTTPVTGTVSTWDTGHAGVFTLDVANIMTQPTLHHDAIQPVAHG